MAERTYSPFTGFAKKGTTGASAGGKSKAIEAKLQPIDWSTQPLQPANKWKILDLSGVEKASGKNFDGESHKDSHSKRANYSSPSAAAMTKEEAEAWRASHSITLSEGTTPPITQFSMLTTVPQYVVQKLLSQGFKEPTPIQAQAWPILMTGRDLVGIAKTGSGKTLAFMLPALIHISQQAPLRPGDGPICLVLAPTRELAQQIEAEALKVTTTTIRIGCIYGGSPKGPQLGMLRQGVHVLVATPGRLIDFVEIKRVNLLRVTYLVLDEADRMLDMGFEPQVRAICGQIRPERQTLMFSATWPKEIQNLASTFQHEWIRINVGSSELLANKDVSQEFFLTTEGGKFDVLKKLLEERRNQRNLIFCKTKKTADYLEYQLKRLGVDIMAIHGDKQQQQREFILERFRRDKRLCVVATDVAARGLDIKELETVINFDFPMQIGDYVHRIGRTGRAGAKGEAITLLTKREDQLSPSGVLQLIGIVERAGQPVPDWLREWGESGYGYGGGAIKRNRNAMGNFSGRNAPQMQRPSFQTHRGRSSFDPSTSGASSNYFGLGDGNNNNKNTSSGGSGTVAPFGMAASSSSNTIKNVQFTYSDSDDDENSSPPTKRKK